MWSLFSRPPRKEDHRAHPFFEWTRFEPFSNPLEADAVREGIKAIALGAAAGPVHSLFIGWWFNPNTMLDYMKKDALKRGALYGGFLM